MKMRIDELKPHPRNAEFFDDIEGEKWDEFLESIDKNGVIEPLIITQDNVIVSGHQRVRALKEIGKKETVNCIVRVYENEDEIVRDLIETNIRQRGNVGGSAQKMGRRIRELERIYGVRQGSAFDANRNPNDATQADIQKEVGLGASAYARYRKMADMIPELSEAVDAGTVTQGTALAIMRQLSEEEQLNLISGLDITRQYAEKEAAERIEEALRNRPVKEPDDYKEVKSDLERAKTTISGMKKDYARARDDLKERTDERNALRNKLKTIEEADAGNARKKHQIETGAMFEARVKRFIEDVSGYIWLTDEVMELPESDRITFIRALKNVQDWANQMEANIRSKMEES